MDRPRLIVTVRLLHRLSPPISKFRSGYFLVEPRGCNSTNASERHNAAVASSPRGGDGPVRRARPAPAPVRIGGDPDKVPIIEGGRRYCRRCFDETGEHLPNDRQHPNSPYCADHRKQVDRELRAASKAKRKEREINLTFAKLNSEGIHVADDGALSLTPDAALALRLDLAALVRMVNESEAALTSAAAAGSISMTKTTSDELILAIKQFINQWLLKTGDPEARPGRPRKHPDPESLDVHE